MEDLDGKIKLGSREWFEHRAFASLKKIDDGIYDFSDSLLLYLPGSDDEYANMQEEESAYNRLITTPERMYLKKIAEDVVKALPPKFVYVDLGPGTAHKEQFFFDEARKQEKKFTYMPVDISERFLKAATTHASEQGIDVIPLRTSFEELRSRLPSSDSPLFISLGLTYSNYEPQEILRFLKGIAGNEGYIFINSQLRERVDMPELIDVYEKDISTIAHSKLNLLGFAEDDIERIRIDENLRVWCTIKKSTHRLERLGITPGVDLLIFQSLRPTKESLKQELTKASVNFALFDTNDSFVAALIHGEK